MRPPILSQRRLPPLLPLAILGAASLAALLALAFSNALELGKLAREDSASYKENVIDQSASLSRVIFAAHRVLIFSPLPGEAPQAALERRLNSSAGLLSHAQYVTRIDPNFLAPQLGSDPLLLGERSAESDRDYEAALAGLRGTLELATASRGIAVAGRLLDDFASATGRFMVLLEARSMVLVQLEDYLFATSKARIAHLVSHSEILILSFSALFLVLGASIALYLRSMLKTQAELSLHRSHLSEMVDQRTSELSTALREKDTLLKEVYHRVKNNLTMVNSLISLQKSESPREALGSYEDLESRIQAISLIHEKLYRSSDLQNIDMGEYLGELASSLLRSLRDEPGSIEVELVAPAIRLPADILIPLGLIATEIVTNSIKHGFGARPRGKVSIRAARGERGLELVIADDGAAPESAETILRSRSLGALLVQDLCGQLGGSLELSVEGGVSYHFVFPGIG